MKSETFRREHGEDPGEGVLKTPLGTYTWRGYAGLIGLVVVILAASLGAIIWMVRDAQVSHAEALARVVTAQNQHAEQVAADRVALKAQQDKWWHAVVWMLSLPERERVQLNIRKPDMIRELER